MAMPEKAADDAALSDLIKTRIRDVPDYPQPGGVFQDINPQPADGQAPEAGCGLEPGGPGCSLAIRSAGRRAGGGREPHCRLLRFATRTRIPGPLIQPSTAGPL